MKTHRTISQRLALTGMTAAAYAALTWALYFLSYREIQFRVSEILNLLAFINPAFAPGIILGCFVANLASPFGIIDVLIGTAATAIGVFFITRTKNLFVAALCPVISNIIVGAEIFFMVNEPPYTFLPFLLITLSVIVGEFVVLVLAGYPLFRFILLKNEKLVLFLKSL